MSFIKRSQLDLDSVIHKKVTIVNDMLFIKRSQLDLDSVIHKKGHNCEQHVIHKKVTIRSR